MASLHIKDSFKINKAPFEVIDGIYGSYKKYSSEAYTDSFMVRSSKTNQLCRYYVQTENGVVSAMSLFKIKPCADEAKNMAKMLSALKALDKQAFNQFLYDSFCDELKTDADLDAFARKYVYTRTKEENVLAYTVVNYSGFYSTLHCVIKYPQANGITTA